jgi:hypothetical protein
MPEESRSPALEYITCPPLLIAYLDYRKLARVDRESYYSPTLVLIRRGTVVVEPSIG